MAAVVRIYPGGTSAGFAGPGPENPGKRGDVTGWSPAAARRLIAWLWSVAADRLPRSGWAVTLTTGGRPETADEWHAARDALMKRLDRAGYGLQQWVIEWTEAGRPHLHMAVYPTREDAKHLPSTAVSAWLAVCDSHGWPAEMVGQHIAPITDVSGWLQYVSKHASRGVAHYQRQGSPEGWTRTGRLWGKWGDWPVDLPIEGDVPSRVFYRYRQLHAEWQANRLREAGQADAAYRLISRVNAPSQGGRVGVSGWIPRDEAVKLLAEAFEYPGRGAGRIEVGASWQ